MTNPHFVSSDTWAWEQPWLQPSSALDSELLRQVGFVPGLPEILMLRQVHALEHATVWVLSESLGVSTDRVANADHLGGMSTERGFYLYGDVKTGDVSRAVRQALQRITHGEWQLAVHPRCGTNVSVGMLLTAGLALGAAVVLPRGPIEQLLGIGMAAVTAAQLAPDLGQWAQQYVTTAIPFNLMVQDIALTLDEWGRPAHFIAVQWVEELGDARGR